MRIRVGHHTRYSYREPVFLEPHQIRLRPRADPNVSVLRYDLAVTPARPVRWHLDVEGNAVASFWFDAPTAELRIDVEAEVRTSLADPFDFLLDAGAVELPVEHHPDDARRLRAYRRRCTGPVAEFAAAVRASSGAGTLAFLTALCAEAKSRVRMRRRPHGPPRPAARTLALGEGACRDVAVLYADAVRSQGLAARFVSGWFADADSPEGHDLHAWTEVYLPGAGWRGFDPSRGIAVNDLYVPLAASAAPKLAAPVSGTYRGKVRGTMEARLTVESAAT